VGTASLGGGLGMRLEPVRSGLFFFEDFLSKDSSSEWIVDSERLEDADDLEPDLLYRTPSL